MSLTTVEKMFEYATRNKLRFPYKGNVSVEDLWDLKLNDLDSVFKTLNRKVKQTEEESLLTVKSVEDTELSIQIEIVKYIFNTKTAEANAKLAEKERKEYKQKLMEIKAAKQEQALWNMSEEELDKLLKEAD